VRATFTPTANGGGPSPPPAAFLFVALQRELEQRDVQSAYETHSSGRQRGASSRRTSPSDSRGMQMIEASPGALQNMARVGEAFVGSGAVSGRNHVPSRLEHRAPL